MRAETAKGTPGATIQRFTDAGIEFMGQQKPLPDFCSVQAEAMSPVKVCLLLRLGEAALAEQFWAGWMAGSA